MENFCRQSLHSLLRVAIHKTTSFKIKFDIMKMKLNNVMFIVYCLGVIFVRFLGGNISGTM